MGYASGIAEPRTKLGTLFSILYSFHLHKSQFHWSRAAEDAHEHFDSVMVGIDLIHQRIETQERPIDDANIVPLHKSDLLSRAAVPESTCLSKESASSLVNGTGLAPPPPTKPVTFGVSLII